VIGAGNPERRDDGAGPALALRLTAAAAPSFDVASCPGEATAVMALFAGRDQVDIVDACLCGEAAGTVLRFDAASQPLPAFLKPLSSHGFGVAEAIELARVLGRLPRRVTVHAIAAEDTGWGQGLSPTVAAAVERLAADFLR
jgi:hydrogenase maturation protease